MKNLLFCIKKNKMYALTSYTLHSITPLSDLRSKDWKYLNMAANMAEKSSFKSSHRLGACIEGKGRCLLCR